MDDKILKLFNKSKFNKPTPKPYDKFALQPNTADFERLYQSGDPIGSRNSYIPRTRKSGLAIAASASEGGGGYGGGAAAPTVTTRVFRSWFEKRVVQSGSQFLFDFADSDNDLNIASFTLSSDGLLSSSIESTSTVRTRVTGSLSVGLYSYTGSIADTGGQTTTFSSSFNIFSGSFVAMNNWTTIHHSSSLGSGSLRWLASPIYNYSASQLKEYIAGFVSPNGGAGNKVIREHTPLVAGDRIYASNASNGNFPFSTVERSRTYLYQEPTTGNYLIYSGGISPLSGSSDNDTEFAQIFVVGNTGSTPPITRDGSDGFPALSSWP